MPRALTEVFYGDRNDIGGLAAILERLRDCTAFEFTDWRLKQHDSTLVTEIHFAKDFGIIVSLSFKLPDGQSALTQYRQDPIHCSADCRGFADALWMLDRLLDARIGTDLVEDAKRFQELRRSTK